MSKLYFQTANIPELAAAILADFAERDIFPMHRLLHFRPVEELDLDEFGDMRHDLNFAYLQDRIVAGFSVEVQTEDGFLPIGHAVKYRAIGSESETEVAGYVRA